MDQIRGEHASPIEFPMNFEICIQGPKAEITKLYRQLKPFSPRLRKIPDWSDESTLGRLQIAITRNLEPSLLDQELLSLSKAMTALGNEAAEGGLFDMRVRNLDYSEPSSGSDGFLEPFRPTSTLLVEPWSPRLGRRIRPNHIYLDPGHAFGTGKHPTTRLCLQILDSLIQAGLHIKRALDFGCGTGILAMAAVRLGAHQALGVEMDAASAKTAKRNVRLNRLEQRIEIREGSWDAVEGPFDLVLANLVASALFRTGDRIAGYMEDPGWAVVSGLGMNQVGEVLPVLEKSGLVLDRQYDLDGWAGLLLRKRPSIKSPRALC
jgi:ribosomal protein L11 methylase PrmA